MNLEREQNPLPAPEPKGALSKEVRVKIAVVGGGVLIFMMIIGWVISRLHAPSSVMGPRQQVPTVAQIGAQHSRLDEAREEAYAQGKREGAQGVLANQKSTDVGTGSMNQLSGGNTSPAAPLTPVVAKHTVKEDYEELLKRSADSGNVVESKESIGGAVGSLASSVGHTDPALLPELPSTGHLPTDLTEKLDKPKQVILNSHTLPAGTFVYCALVNQLNGDNVGPVKVQVSNDVPWPGTMEIAIPQGSVILGEAQKVNAQFQQRLAVSFHLLQIGNTAGSIRQISLDKFPGLDQQGATALKDKVDNHYLQIFGTSLAIGAIGGLAQIGSGSYGGLNGYDTETQIRNGMTQTMAQNSSQILNRFLNRLPTVIIRPGTPVVVYLTANLELPE